MCSLIKTAEVSGQWLKITVSFQTSLVISSLLDAHPQCVVSRFFWSQTSSRSAYIGMVSCWNGPRPHVP